MKVPKPFLKWAGGKWSLAPKIFQLLPIDIARRTYREPFVGGGAMYFYLVQYARPKTSYLSDALGDLIRAYRVVREDTDDLIRHLAALNAEHSEETFYNVRKRYNTELSAPAVERAAWLIYLNKTCFNGLYRTNREGVFNVPFGRFKKPAILDEPRLRTASEALRGANLANKPFEHLEKAAKPGDVIYFDPPYVPLSKTANFASYAEGDFTLDDQQRLADLFKVLDKRGCLLALSNSDTPEVRDLYAGFDIKEVVAHRSISSKAKERKPVGEVLVRNNRRNARWPKER